MWKNIFAPGTLGIGDFNVLHHFSSSRPFHQQFTLRRRPRRVLQTVPTPLSSRRNSRPSCLPTPQIKPTSMVFRPDI